MLVVARSHMVTLILLALGNHPGYLSNLSNLIDLTIKCCAYSTFLSVQSQKGSHFNRPSAVLRSSPLTDLSLLKLLDVFWRFEDRG